MKNIIITFLLILAATSMSWSQENYIIDGSSGKLSILEVNSVTLVGTDDNKVTIEIEGGRSAVPDKAKGLRLINPAGLTDNSGIGLSVQKEGDTHVIRSLSSKAKRRYIFKVPHNYFVHYESSGVNGKQLIVEDLKAELDVSVNYNSVRLSGVTGPMAIHAVYKTIEANFETVSQEGPISLYSVYQDVDVTVPSTTKAVFKLNVNYGDMYSDLDLKYPEGEGGMKNLSGKNMGATFNGGGVSFTIKSGYKNIYLRKK